MFSAIGVKGGTTVGIGRGGKNLIEKKKKNRVNLNAGGYIGSAINSEYGGKKLSNKSYEKYYKGMI
jgi:hypothetical protein|tara:strand:+ start:222 stop:419 length:198 start_codon:yes stop_codon:yes gene_type:complete